MNPLCIRLKFLKVMETTNFIQQHILFQILFFLWMEFKQPKFLTRKHLYCCILLGLIHRYLIDFFIWLSFTIESLRGIEFFQFRFRFPRLKTFVSCLHGKFNLYIIIIISLIMLYLNVLKIIDFIFYYYFFFLYKGIIFYNLFFYLNVNNI